MNLATSYPGQGDARNERDDLNDIVVRGYSPMGSVVGIGYGSAQVEAREGLIPGRQMASQSVRIEMNSGGDYPQIGSAAVAYDNLDRLISALGQLQFTTINNERFVFTEVEYEIDGFKTIVFNNERGGMMFALSAESVSIHFNGLGKLGELKSLIEKAKKHLDGTKVG